MKNCKKLVSAFEERFRVKYEEFRGEPDVIVSGKDG